jgi:tripartite-type tricarboxylate transporter receptor subunit TctC
MARIMGQKLSEVWGQPVIIESKPGAAGSIGMEFAARQPWTSRGQPFADQTALQHGA